MDWFSKLFGKSLTPEQMLRKNQRALSSAIRNIEKEKSRMEREEKKLILDIKKMAKDGQMDAVRIMSKDIIRTRRYIKKFMLMKANVQAVGMRIVTLRSQHSVGEAMKSVTIAMRSMNRQMNVPRIQNILQEFERQSAISEMKNDIMEDTIDDVLEEDDEDESDNLVSQILDELGLQLKDQLCELPAAKGNLSQTRGKIPLAAKGGMSSSGGLNSTCASKSCAPNDKIDADLQLRLDNLRRDTYLDDLPDIPKSKPR